MENEDNKSTAHTRKLKTFQHTMAEWAESCNTIVHIKSTYK